MRIVEEHRMECTAEKWRGQALNLQQAHLTPRYYNENNIPLEGLEKYMKLLIDTYKCIPTNMIPYKKLNPDIPITVQVHQYHCNMLIKFFKSQNNFKNGKSCPFETPAAKISKKNYLNYDDISPGIFANNKLRRAFYLLFCTVHPAFEIELIEDLVPEELDTCASPGVQITKIATGIFNNGLGVTKRLACLDFPDFKKISQECYYESCNQKHQFRQAMHEIISIAFPGDASYLMDKHCDDSWIDKCHCDSSLNHLNYRVCEVFKNIVEVVAMGYYYGEIRQLAIVEC